MLPVVAPPGVQRREVQFSAPTLGREELAEIAAAMQEGWVATGPRAARLQTALRSYLGVDHLVCLNSCTAGLTLALALLEVGHGDEVLVPAMTYVACANVVAHRGARPVLVDADPATGLVDLDDARRRIGPRTRAAFVVHLHGRPLDMEAVNAFTAETGVSVIEDAAHAIGARWRDVSIGGWGNPTSFSFHASKNMTTFDGGALVLSDAEQLERATRLAMQGMSRAAWQRHDDAAPGVYDVEEPGYKFAMHDVAAAAGLHQLRRLEGWRERRAQLAGRYDHLLADHPAIELLPPVPAHARHAHHVYSVRLRPEARDRDEVARDLHHQRIGSSVHFRALHLHTWFRRQGWTPEDLPNATALSRSLLSLPLHPQMEDEDVDAVVAALDAATGYLG
jgi:dTDP-4-amino-4,6-dideoxygalactose transaminase